MPRTSVTSTVPAVLAAAAASIAAAQAPSPHVDLSTVLTGCPACHVGHGASDSPMLAVPQRQVCLKCHNTPGEVSDLISEGVLSNTAQPPLMADVLSLPFLHPVSDEATSSREPGNVTCASCHSPHRGTQAAESPGTGSGRRKTSPKNPNRFEFELCEDCHGSEGATTQKLTDISRLFNPNNASYHPVEAASLEPSPSLLPPLTGGEINCTDCHGNSDPAGARGPHGSSTPYILKDGYVLTDGGSESPKAYALCYQCHQREKVLDSTTFPRHTEHVQEASTSCATCHNPHGSVANRALIRFGEETTVVGVSPSSSGRLAFESSAPSAGACFLSCHGKDHDPLGYGPGFDEDGKPLVTVVNAARPAPGAGSARAPRGSLKGSPPPRGRPGRPGPRQPRPPAGPPAPTPK